jgi:predicted secreted protein
MSRTLALSFGLAALVVTISAAPAVAQVVFERTYGGAQEDKAFTVLQLSDNGYIVGGQTRSFGAGSTDLWLVRTDANGDTIWTRCFGGAQDDSGTAVAIAPDGFLFMGQTASFGAGGSDIWLIKTNAAGDTQWTRCYGGPGPERYGSLIRLQNGEIVLCGATASSGAGGMDVWVVKTDASGNQLWAKTYGGAGDDVGLGITPTSDSGFVVCGYTTSYGAGNGDCWVLKLTAEGDTQWTRTYGGPQPDGAGCAIETPGGYVIGANTMSFGAGGWDLYAVGITATGDTLWTKTHGGQSDDWGFGGSETADGNVVLSGYVEESPSDRDVSLGKFVPGGSLAWARTYGGPNVDEGRGCALTSDGGFCIAGSTNSFGAGDHDFYLVKTDSLGNVGVAEPLPARQPRPRIALSCWPNPASGNTAVSYSVKSGSVAELTVRDLCGRRVRSLEAEGGTGRVVWNGLDDYGQPVPAAAYVCRLVTAEGATATAAISIVR